MLDGKAWCCRTRNAPPPSAARRPPTAPRQRRRHIQASKEISAEDSSNTPRAPAKLCSSHSSTTRKATNRKAHLHRPVAGSGSNLFCQYHSQLVLGVHATMVLEYHGTLPWLLSIQLVGEYHGTYCNTRVPMVHTIFHMAIWQY
jgi:hypothetical protein